ncbi:MAG: choice-of-anchor D domain-containing protein, partial [Acidimicrobiales bacterium]
TSLAFGSVPVGQLSGTQVVTVTNLSPTTLNVASATTTFPFFVASTTCDGATLALLQSCSVNVDFDAASLGSHSGTLTLSTSGGCSTVSLSGTASSAPPVVFGQTITFTSTPPINPTGGTYTVAAMASSGLTVGFTIDGSSTVGTCSISGSVVSFLSAGRCVIDANQGGNATFSPAPQVQQTVSVFSTGQPVAPLITFQGPLPLNSPAFNGTLAFGSVVIGSTSSAQTLTVTADDQINTLTLSAPTVSGPFQVVATTCTGAALKYLQTCAISVAYVPSSTGSQTGTLFVNDNSFGAPQTVNLTGTGVSQPTNLVAQKITFTSTPPINPTGGTYTVAASASSVLSVSFTIDAASTAGACTIATAVVTFTGPGSCVIDANQAGNSTFAAAPRVQQVVTVASTQPTSPPLLSSTSLSFGAVKVGSTSNPQTVTLLNVDPIHSLAITGTSGIGTFNASAIAGTCNAFPTMGFLQSCTFVVTFDPTSTGPASGSITIFDTAGSQTLTLTGTGI